MHILVHICLFRQDASLAQKLPLDVPHVTLCDERPAPEVVAFIDLLEDHEVFVHDEPRWNFIWVVAILLAFVEVQSLVLE